jgi:hypothetical protein
VANPANPLTAGAGPAVTPPGDEACGIAFGANAATPSAKEVAKEALEAGEDALNQAESWIEQRRREFQRQTQSWFQ